MPIFKKMPPNYSRERDVLRCIQCLVVGCLGVFLAVKYLRYSQLAGILMFAWIAGFIGASVFFGARAFFSWVYRL
jgi:hypothetical protein